MQHDVAWDMLWDLVYTRFVAVRDNLGLSYPIEEDLQQIAKEVKAKKVSVDYLVSRGEYLTARLMADYLAFTFVDAQAVIIFDYAGQIDMKETRKRANEKLSHTEKIILPGFYGANPNGKVKLMERGGSDITGAILASVLGASVYENWTDVSGIMMADRSGTKRIFIFAQSNTNLNLLQEYGDLGPRHKKISSLY